MMAVIFGRHAALQTITTVYPSVNLSAHTEKGVPLAAMTRDPTIQDILVVAILFFLWLQPLVSDQLQKAVLVQALNLRLIRHFLWVPWTKKSWTCPLCPLPSPSQPARSILPHRLNPPCLSMRIPTSLLSILPLLRLHLKQSHQGKGFPLHSVNSQS